MTDIHGIMLTLGDQARQAAAQLAFASAQSKSTALQVAAQKMRDAVDQILVENAKDMEFGRNKGLSAAMLDRLMLDTDRVHAIADALEIIAQQDDPVGRVLDAWDRPNGLHIQKVTTPLGVIGVIYESRPNVTADAGALCLKAGNAVILRGGSESYYSSNAIYNSLKKGLIKAGLPKYSIQIIPTTDRNAVGYLLSGLDDSIDVVVPRGGKSLVERVQNEAKVPVFGHLEGICHIYIDKDADIKKAQEVTVNAKMRRTGICGAAETLLIDKKNAEIVLPKIANAF